jgi:hypothetical protein
MAGWGLLQRRDLFYFIRGRLVSVFLAFGYCGVMGRNVVVEYRWEPA